MSVSNLLSKEQDTLAEVHKTLPKIKRLDYQYYHALVATLLEWNSPADEEAYSDL